jgi:mRNA interferase MazF
LIATAPYQWSVYSIDLDSVRGAGRTRGRPVLVVSRETANEALPVVTVLPLATRRKGRRVYPNEVLLPSGVGGLKRDAIAMAHQTRTVSKDSLRTPLGTIEDDNLKNEIRAALCIQLNLERA